MQPSSLHLLTPSSPVGNPSGTPEKCCTATEKTVCASPNPRCSRAERTREVLHDHGDDGRLSGQSERLEEEAEGRDDVDVHEGKRLHVRLQHLNNGTIFWLGSSDRNDELMDPD